MEDGVNADGDADESRETDDRLRLAVEAAEMGTWELDLQSGESPVRSRQHDQIFGYEEPVEDWSLDRFLEHVHPDDRADVERRFETALETGEWRFECRIRRADGEQRWIMAQGEFFYDGGEPVRAVGIVQDVTERKERQRELERQNKRLESFASMLAHEVRNPLGIAQIYLQHARRGDDDAFDQVETAHERIEEMITVLLVLAEGKQSAVDPEPVCLGGLATEVWETLSAPDGRLRVETDLVVEAEPHHLRHILENLFENALEHGGDDVAVRVGGLDDGFYVADDGRGVPEPKREQVFEAGYTTDTSGIGLGLTFIGQLADAYGWDCRVAESETEGARFEFTDVDVVSTG
ncbi:sensor histidine kinase [Natrononativus amylolyticus]|uniref:sensor histidine kinase n=1 Tax=Natrononativus amylolyticus TaxID=2963434 RepID=UPI0020CCA1D0|nr:PAS domain-containing sensor histidine kinase [Natrononativus amylolyticus]